MSNKIIVDSISEYEKLLIIAAREADERAREDALNLLKSRKSEEYIYEDGEEKKFTSMMGALDYMSKRGWHLHTIYVLQETVFNKVENVTHYLMVKFVTDDSQKRDGLDLQTK